MFFKLLANLWPPYSCCYLFKRETVPFSWPQSNFRQYNQILYCNEVPVMLGIIFVCGCLLVLILACLYYIFQYISRKLGMEKHIWVNNLICTDIVRKEKFVASQNQLMRILTLLFIIRK